MRAVLAAIFTLFIVSSCSIQKLAIKSTSGLFSYGIEAIYSEPDLKLAEQAIASNLKLLEGFHRADPNNKNLLLMLTQGYASYALAFVEDQDPVRASMFYKRAREFGMQLLQHSHPFKSGIPKQEGEFLGRVNMLGRADVPALFWTAFAWAGWINLNRDLPQAVFDLNKVKGMMQRVLELDEGFFFGAAHLFFGSIDGSLPKMLGGDPERARRHFLRSLELSDGKFLMADVYLARYYAVTTLNDSLFTETLREVVEAPVDILPGYQLLTSVAKQKAKILLSKKEEFF